MKITIAASVAGSIILACAVSSTPTCAQTPTTPILVPLQNGMTPTLSGNPGLSPDLKVAPTAQSYASPAAAAAPELPIAALPALGQVYWLSYSSDEYMHRLRSEAAALWEEYTYYQARRYQDGLTYSEKLLENQDNAEMDAQKATEYWTKYNSVIAQIRARRTELQMKPLPVPDNVDIVPHTGTYSVVQSGTSQAVSYVHHNVADTPEKTSGSHVEVTYHIVNVIVPMGFASDGTPLTRSGMDIVRVEKTVSDN